MDVTATLSLGDPLEPARKATAEMLQNRERTFSLPQPFYNDERLFEIDISAGDMAQSVPDAARAVFSGWSR